MTKFLVAISKPFLNYTEFIHAYSSPVAKPDGDAYSIPVDYDDLLIDFEIYSKMVENFRYLQSNS